MTVTFHLAYRYFIRCDTPLCTASLFAGSPESTRAEVSTRAESVGWDLVDDDRHICPWCLARRPMPMQGGVTDGS